MQSVALQVYQKEQIQLSGNQRLLHYKNHRFFSLPGKVLLQMPNHKREISMRCTSLAIMPDTWQVMCNNVEKKGREKSDFLGGSTIIKLPIGYRRAYTSVTSV